MTLMPRLPLLLALSLLAVPLVGEENLIRNPGFEELQGSGPRFWKPLAGGAEPVASGESPAAGARCLFFDLERPGTAGALQRVTVKPDTAYRLTVRVRTHGLSAAGPGAHLFIKDLNALSNDFSGTTDNWQEAVLFIKTEPGQTTIETGVRVGAAGQPAEGKAWFDDFRMTEAAAAEPLAAVFGPAAPFPWGLLAFALAAALLLGGAAWLLKKKRPPLKGPLLDLILAGGLTLVYAFIAFYNLGSFDAPQTYYRAERQGEGFVIDLGERVPLSKVNYFLALGAGSFDLEFSNDLSAWSNRQTIGQDNIYSMIEWRTLAGGFDARYIRVTAMRPGVMLGEIGAFRDGALAPARSVLPAEGRLPPATDPAAVCDEPGRVPESRSYLNSMYFDETYHARAAYEYVLRQDSTETTHPPLGKLTIAAGVLAFGFDPFGWRFMGALFGALMVPFMYAFGLALFKKRIYAFTGAFLFAFDFMHFVQTRIATIDVYGVFWIILMYYFMYRALTLDPFARKPKKYFLFLFLSGLSFGLGAASKWIALYGGVGLAVVFIIPFFYRLFMFVFEFVRSHTGAGAAQAAEEADEKGEAPPNPGRAFARFFVTLATRIPIIIAFSTIVFIVLPALIYFASYLPFLAVRGPQHPDKTAVELVWQEQQFMYNYHATLQATHDFASPWYQWPVMARPIWYYSGKPAMPDNLTSSIAAFGNPAVWWPGGAAAIALIVILLVFGAAALARISVILVRLIRKQAPEEPEPQFTIRSGVIGYLKKTGPALFIVVALAAQYVPWIVIPRKLTFIYHYFASVPFLVFCIVHIIKLILEKRPKARWAVFAYLGLVLGLFIMFYPVLSGWPADTGYVENALRWFPGWVF
jgi:dolichyl-phosphate-mannose-protein mannosyltransferase